MLIQDIKPHKEACSDCQHIEKLHNGLASHGLLEADKAVLMVFNEAIPHKSQLLVERFELPEEVECKESVIGIHFLEYRGWRRVGRRMAVVLTCANCGAEELYCRGERIQ